MCLIHAHSNSWLLHRKTSWNFWEWTCSSLASVSSQRLESLLWDWERDSSANDSWRRSSAQKCPMLKNLDCPQIKKAKSDLILYFFTQFAASHFCINLRKYLSFCCFFDQFFLEILFWKKSRLFLEFPPKKLPNINTILNQLMLTKASREDLCYQKLLLLFSFLIQRHPPFPFTLRKGTQPIITVITE